jgi:hypothetical protein
MIEMTIDSIRVSLMNYQRVVILKKKNPTGTCPSGSAPRRPMPSPLSSRAWRCPPPDP